MLDLYRLVGMDFEVLAKPRWVEGELRYPAQSTVATIHSAICVMQRLVA